MESKHFIEGLIAAAEKYGLDGLDKIRRIGVDAVVAAYNGTGPEWFSERLRVAIDKLSEVFLPAVMIHDVDYAHGEGTHADFVRANNRLESNMLTIADIEYSWYNPLRYIRRRQARIFAELCRAFGWIAYNK